MFAGAVYFPHFCTRSVSGFTTTTSVKSMLELRSFAVLVGPERGSVGFGLHDPYRFEVVFYAVRAQDGGCHSGWRMPECNRFANSQNRPICLHKTRVILYRAR